jgi:Mg2+-importing ATPase
MMPEKYKPRSLVLISVVLGSCTALFELLYFALVTMRTPGYIQTSMFLFLTLLQLIVVVSIRHCYSFWTGSGPPPILALAIGLAFVVSVALPYLPFSAHLFGFSPLPLQELAIALGLAIVYVVALDLVKVWYYRKIKKEAPPGSQVQPVRGI